MAAAKSFPADDGAYSDLNDFVYRQKERFINKGPSPRVNYSSLKAYADSPERALAAFGGNFKQSPEMFLGELWHCRVGEPTMFDKRFRLAACGRQAKAFKVEAEAAALEGVRLYTQKEIDHVDRMDKAVWLDPAAAAILEAPGLETELVIAWTDEATGLPCKAKLDFVNRDARHAGDLKTTVDASPGGFSRQCANLYYHAQQAFYMDGLAAVFPGDPWRWSWIAVEKEKSTEQVPLHAVGVYAGTEATYSYGRWLYRKWLQMHADCVKAGAWPGYSAGNPELELPHWHTRQIDREADAEGENE